jgi:ABC-type multidrug transport system fused ATPase/permease subunit
MRCARILDWARSLPEGWNAMVGEGGARISGGQRQRVGLARAFLAGSPILVLDEPTARLDPEHARALMNELMAVDRPGTLLVMTHRLLAMERMDEIVVLDRGRVAERGSHAQLIERRGTYRRMWDLEHVSRPAG